jgi:hypothetical protein
MIKTDASFRDSTRTSSTVVIVALFRGVYNKCLDDAIQLHYSNAKTATYSLMYTTVYTLSPAMPYKQCALLYCTVKHDADKVLFE